MTSEFVTHPFYRPLTMSWDHLVTELTVFKNRNSTIRDIHGAGIKLVSASEDLKLERVRLFKERCNSKTRKKQISLGILPPTVDTEKLHS